MNDDNSCGGVTFFVRAVIMASLFGFVAGNRERWESTAADIRSGEICVKPNECYKTERIAAE